MKKNKDLSSGEERRSNGGGGREVGEGEGRNERQTKKKQEE